jgi:hypothetical protein
VLSLVSLSAKMTVPASARRDGWLTHLFGSLTLFSLQRQDADARDSIKGIKGIFEIYLDGDRDGRVSTAELRAVVEGPHGVLATALVTGKGHSTDPPPIWREEAGETATGETVAGQIATGETATGMTTAAEAGRHAGRRYLELERTSGPNDEPIGTMRTIPLEHPPDQLVPVGAAAPDPPPSEEHDYVLGLSAPARGVHAALAFPTVNRVCVACLCGCDGRARAPKMAVSSPGV